MSGRTAACDPSRTFPKHDKHCLWYVILLDARCNDVPTRSASDFEDEPSGDYKWVIAWLERWKTVLRVANYSTGGWEHIWDIEAPEDAIAEVPNNLLCASEWSGWTVPRK